MLTHHRCKSNRQNEYMAQEKRNQFVTYNLIIALWIALGLGSYHLLTVPQKAAPSPEAETTAQQTVCLASERTAAPPPAAVESPNFISAAKKATPAVVHIMAKYEAKVMQRGQGANPLEELFKELFGEKFDLGPREYKTQPSSALGSGVIIDPEGYIVTNNHVVEGADVLEVTLNDNRRYTATIVGTDPDTDLALIKIEAQHLPYLRFGDSDKLQIAEWVLAVGNPFNLTSTVTKGIVSAKARRADLSKIGASIKIESFIQTDAAINKGNSGGALVNMQGELVGINTAIPTPTGAFAGYAFAIPSAIAERVVQDLRKYGNVQRAILGIFIREVDADLATEKKLSRFSGVYIEGFTPHSTAAEAGLKQGDVIVGVNDHPIKNLAQLHEQLARYQPDDKIRVTVDRKGKSCTLSVVLTNAVNKIKLVRTQHTLEGAGATFENTDKATQQKLGITGGVQIKTLKAGKWQEAGIKKGFIITAIDKETVDNLDQLADILNSKQGGILVAGVYPSGTVAYYGLGWGDE